MRRCAMILSLLIASGCERPVDVGNDQAETRAEETRAINQRQLQELDAREMARLEERRKEVEKKLAEMHARSKARPLQSKDDPEAVRKEFLEARELWRELKAIEEEEMQRKEKSLGLRRIAR